MENTLRHLRALYPDAFPDHPLSPAEASPLLDADASVRAEAEALAEAKFYLDMRSPSRPDAGVLDAIMEAAVVAAPPASEPVRRARQDRPAAPRAARNRKRRAGLVAAFALTVALGVGTIAVLAPAPHDAPVAVSPPPTAVTEAPPAAVTTLPTPQPVRAETVTPVQVEAVAAQPSQPAWDEAEADLVALGSDLERLETLAAELDDIFATPATPLEAAPRPSASALGQVGPADGKGDFHVVIARRNR